MDSPDNTQPNPERIIRDLRSVIENAEELLKNTDQYLGGDHQQAREQLTMAVHAAMAELSRIETQELERMMARTDEAARQHEDRTGEARLMRAFSVCQ